jgi:Domain of unknown function (DUF1905)
MIEGTINGFPFRAALEPNGKVSHWLRVNKALHDAAGADAGDTVTTSMLFRRYKVAYENHATGHVNLRRRLKALCGRKNWCGLG